MYRVLRTQNPFYNQKDSSSPFSFQLLTPLVEKMFKKFKIEFMMQNLNMNMREKTKKDKVQPSALRTSQAF